MDQPIPSGFFAASGTGHPSGAASHRDLHAACGEVHLPSYCLNEGDGPGWPATGGLVSPDAGQLPEWRVKYNAARRERRREQCRAAHRRWLDKTRPL